MPPRRPHPSTADLDRVAACLYTMDVARSQLRDRTSARDAEKIDAREDLLDALERYVEAIAALGAPAPRRIVAEIELYRRLLDAP